MSRTPLPEISPRDSSRNAWAVVLLGFSAVVSLSFLTSWTPAAWVFALLAALFPIPLLRLTGQTIGKATLAALGVLFLIPPAGLLLLHNQPHWNVEARFSAAALLMLIGFWLLPFVATTLLYSRTYSKRPGTQSQPPRRAAGGKDS